MNGEQDEPPIKPLFENDFLRIHLHPQYKYLVADWSGMLDAQRARNGCNAILNSLADNKTSKILNNNSKVTGHYPGAIDWVGKVWFPSLYTLGVRWFAWVYSPEFYTQLGTDKIVSFNSLVTINTFYDEDSAHLWLTSKPDL